MFGDSSQSVTHYLTFLSPDGISKEVTYDISRHWTYSNYIGLTAGIAAVAAGALMFGLMLLKDKLRNFNKALENQV
jgi:nitrate reductase gamma subunit